MFSFISIRVVRDLPHARYLRHGLFLSYDLDLPENKSKTVSQLKDGLTKRGIDFLANARKTQLIKLWKNYVMTMTGPDPVDIPEIDSCTHSNRHDTLPDVNAICVTSIGRESRNARINETERD